MNRRAFITLAMFIALQPRTAQPRENDGGQIEDATRNEIRVYTNLINFLKSLLQAVNQLGDDIDRDRLISYLESLEPDFGAMIQAKRKIAGLIGQELPNRDKIRDAATTLQHNAESASNCLAGVPLQFGQQFIDQGHDVASELQTIFTVKQSWVHQLLMALPNASRSDLASYATKADTSANALEVANTELARLIYGLKGRP
jgi:hypothetical protein